MNDEKVDVAMILKKYSCANCERWGECCLSEVIPLDYNTPTVCLNYKPLEYPYELKEICELSQQTQCKFVSEYFEKVICEYIGDPPKKSYVYHVEGGKIYNNLDELVYFDMTEILSKWRLVDERIRFG